MINRLLISHSECFELILEKYFDDNIIGKEIIQHINDRTYKNDEYREEYWRHFSSDSYEAIELEFYKKITPMCVMALYIDYKVYIVVCIAKCDNVNKIKIDKIDVDFMLDICEKALDIDYFNNGALNTKQMLLLGKIKSYNSSNRNIYFFDE